MSDDTWGPIAEGPLADRLRAAIVDVAEALCDSERTQLKGAAGLAGGDTSLAIFYLYLARAFPDGDWDEVGLSYIERAVERIATGPMDLSLFSGWTGVAWAIEHLMGGTCVAARADALELIEASLIRHLESTSWRSTYGLMDGLVGFGTYAIERLPRPSAKRCLELVIERLDESATRLDGEKVTWLTDPAWLASEMAQRFPQGNYDLGVAHGIPGIVPILAGACRGGIARTRARPLLEGAMRWLQVNRLPDGGPGRFAYHLLPGRPNGVSRRPARAAWCYGDPGVAAALLAGARAVGNERWERDAIELGLLAARRSVADSLVVDTGICHGASGLAHIFNRLHHETGEAAFAGAALLWLERTLDLRQPGEAVAGFPAYRSTPGPTWEADAGLLTGAAGVALVMISAIAPVIPAWDRALACSLAPARSAPAIGL